MIDDIPSTDQVRACYCAERFMNYVDDSGHEFDAWLGKFEHELRQNLSALILAELLSIQCEQACTCDTCSLEAAVYNRCRRIVEGGNVD